MKKSFTIIVLALVASLATAQTSVTFDVDKNLPAPKENIPKYEKVYEVFKKLYTSNKELFKDLGTIG